MDEGGLGTLSVAPFIEPATNMPAIPMGDDKKDLLLDLALTNCRLEYFLASAAFTVACCSFAFSFFNGSNIMCTLLLLSRIKQ